MLYKLKKKEKKENQTQVTLTAPNFQTGYMFFLSGENEVQPLNKTLFFC